MISFFKNNKILTVAWIILFILVSVAWLYVQLFNAQKKYTFRVTIDKESLKQESLLKNDSKYKVDSSGLFEQTKYGNLPRISEDGKKPYQVYASAFDKQNKTPKIAIILNEVGIDTSGLREAIEKLPAAVTISISPHLEDMEKWVTRIRESHKEFLLNIPMEPLDFPDEDPGPYTLLTNITASENLSRFYTVLGKSSQYVGLANVVGGRFVLSSSDLIPIIKEIKKRGLIFLDCKQSQQSSFKSTADNAGIAYGISELTIDIEQSPETIDQALDFAEKKARVQGSVIIIGSTYPLTIERIQKWIPSLEKKALVIAPITAVITPEK